MQATCEITLAKALYDYSATRKLKPKTRKNQEDMVRRCLPDWLDSELAAITKTMVLEKHKRVTEEHGPVQANKTFQILRTVYNFAQIRYEEEPGAEALALNPVKRLSDMRAWNPEKPKKRLVPLHKLKDWYYAVLMMPSPLMRDFLILLLLTGLRKTEAMTLKWSDIDFDGRYMIVRETKNGRDHTLPLTDILIALLQGRANDSEYVFPGPNGHMISPYKAIEGIQKQIGIKFSPHDIRRTFLAVAKVAGVDFSVRKQLVNHTPQDVTSKHYEVQDPEDLRPAMEAVSRTVMELVEL